MFLGITLRVEWGRKQFTMTAFGLWALQVPLMMLLGLKSDQKESRNKKTLGLNRQDAPMDVGTSTGLPQCSDGLTHTGCTKQN